VSPAAPPRPSAPALRCRGLRKRFGSTVAVDGIDLEVAAGEIVGLLGPNGAGKTTTIRILTTLIPADEGTIEVFGHDVAAEPFTTRRLIGYVPQQLSADATLTGRENIELFTRLFDVPRRERRARVDDVLEAMKLTDAADRLAKTYSGGMIRRLELAQALVNQPHLLVLDEPTIGLDPRQITEIRALIRSLAGQHTVILSTHILPEVSMVCDGVIIINRGRIVAQGTESELVEHVFPTARVELHVAAATGDVAQTLRALPAVLGVEALPSRDGAQAFIVESPRDRDVRSDLVALVMSRGWALRELHQVGMSLEEVFIRVVAGEEANEGVTAGEAA
jgi:ABC-2 type transport system ATP-binding protein